MVAALMVHPDVGALHFVHDTEFLLCINDLLHRLEDKPKLKGDGMLGPRYGIGWAAQPSQGPIKLR